MVDGPAGVRLLGVGDPRSSGLGSWRDESGLSFDEVAERLADAACEADEDGDRIATILVHDANMGDEALERGCADLVVGGHLHVQGGPTAVTGENGAVGYSYTTGTTGGAAYAIAVGAAIRAAGRDHPAHLPRRPPGRGPGGHPRHHRRRSRSTRTSSWPSDPSDDRPRNGRPSTRVTPVTFARVAR